jgi:hypothetical protein
MDGLFWLKELTWAIEFNDWIASVVVLKNDGISWLTDQKIPLNIKKETIESVISTFLENRYPDRYSIKNLELKALKNDTQTFIEIMIFRIELVDILINN